MVDLALRGDLLAILSDHLLTFPSFRTSEPSRISPNRHISFAVLGNTGEGRVRVGI
jgi:hypothetical protein